MKKVFAAVSALSNELFYAVVIGLPALYLLRAIKYTLDCLYIRKEI